MPSVLSQLQQQRERRLRDGFRAVRRHIGDGNSPLARRGEVNDIRAGASTPMYRSLGRRSMRLRVKSVLLVRTTPHLRAADDFGLGATLVNCARPERLEFVQLKSPGLSVKPSSTTIVMA